MMMRLLTLVALLVCTAGAQAQRYPTSESERLRPTVPTWSPPVNTTVISVSPYWRPLVLQTPTYYTPGLPYVNYNQSIAFQATPYGYGWNSNYAVWGGIYNPYSGYGYYYPQVYPSYGYSGYTHAGFEVNVNQMRSSFEQVQVAQATTSNGAFYRTSGTGSYSAYGAYLPGTGMYINPFTGAAYNPVTGLLVR